MESYDNLKEFWTEKYAPKTLDDMVITEEIRNHFKNAINSKTRFNCLFSGSAGIGKTTISNIIAKELNASVLYVSCGIEGTVNVAQTKVKRFCECLPMEGKPKIVLLDELDSSSGTQDNSFQKVLRNIINESPDTMFIGTCNYIEKVIEPIRSRLGVIDLKFTPKDLVKRLKVILDIEKIDYDLESLKSFVTNVIKAHYPDIRRIVSILQDSCSSGKLIVSKSVTKTVDNDLIAELVNKSINATNMLGLRQLYISNKMKIDDYMKTASEIYNYVIDNDMVKTSDTILKMNNIIYQLNVVIDKEIAFFALLTLINKELKNV